MKKGHVAKWLCIPILTFCNNNIHVKKKQVIKCVAEKHTLIFYTILQFYVDAPQTMYIIRV